MVKYTNQMARKNLSVKARACSWMAATLESSSIISTTYDTELPTSPSRHSVPVIRVLVINLEIYVQSTCADGAFV